MQTKEEMFFHAATHGNLSLIKQLILEDGIDPDIESGNALGLCAAAGHIEIMDFLLNQGALIDIHSKSGDPALSLAAAANQIESVKFLLSRGADPRVKNAFALRVSITNGHNVMAFYLLTQATFSENELNWALLYATEKDSLEVVRELIKLGAKISPVIRKAASTYKAAKVLSHFEQLDNKKDTMQPPVKQNQDKVVRSKRADWTIHTPNERCTHSIDDFLARLKQTGPDNFKIYFEKKNPKDIIISTLIIEIEKKSNIDYVTSLKLASNSKNEEIYNNFKKFELTTNYL